MRTVVLAVHQAAAARVGVAVRQAVVAVASLSAALMVSVAPHPKSWTRHRRHKHKAMP